MSDSRRLRPGAAVPLGFLGMLALVGAFELGVLRKHPAFHNAEGATWGHTASLLKHHAAGRDILCFGDSQVKLGLIPRILRERTGRPAFNLALLSGSPSSSYFMLRRALEAGSRPSTILVDFAWGHFQLNPWATQYAFLWPELLSFRESVELCWTAGDSDLFGRILAYKYLASARSRFELRAFVRASLGGEAYSEAQSSWIFRRNLDSNDGAMVFGKQPFQDLPKPPGGGKGTGTWEPSPANLRYFHKFLALAAQHKIQVAWLIPPESPASQAWWEFNGDELRSEGFARSILERYRNVVVLDARHSGYDTGVFRDLVHLDREGAQSLSHAAADYLCGKLAPSGPAGWYTLPPFRKPASEVPLEDVEQSRVAISRPPGEGTLVR